MPSLEDLWTVACEHAGYEPELVSLIGVDAAPLHDSFAVHVGPGETLEPEGPMPDSLVGAINGAALAGGHRVGVLTQAPDAVLLGALRHELEHARQFDADDTLTLYRTHALLASSLSRAFPGPGSGVLYQLIPHEHDAHVASTALVHQRGPAPGELLIGTHRPLLSTYPLPIDNLPLEMRAMAFGALLADEIEATCAERGIGVAGLCEALGVDVRKWRAVRDAPDVVERRRLARELSPPVDVLDASSRPQRVTLRQPSRDALVEGYVVAATALGSPA